MEAGAPSLFSIQDLVQGIHGVAHSEVVPLPPFTVTMVTLHMHAQMPLFPVILDPVRLTTLTITPTLRKIKEQEGHQGEVRESRAR